MNMKKVWPDSEEKTPESNDSTTAWPKISIITPSYNQGQFIEETIVSIINQNYPNLEYIIIDGGSTDNTIEIIKKYEKHLAYWISEPDRGQAHAINKGLEKATGEIFQWINSDDYIEAGALLKIAEAFKNKEVDAVAGKTVYFNGNIFEEPIQQSNLSAKGLMFWEKGVKFVQPGVWLRKDKIISCGGIDEQYHYAFDSDMIIRYLSKYPNVRYIDQILVYFRLHGESKTMSSPQGFLDDRVKFIYKISKAKEFKNLKPLCDIWINKNRWSDFLKVNISQKEKKLKRILYILYEILKKPTYRFNRKSFGAIKLILLNK